MTQVCPTQNKAPDADASGVLCLSLRLNDGVVDGWGCLKINSCFFRCNRCSIANGRSKPLPYGVIKHPLHSHRNDYFVCIAFPCKGRLARVIGHQLRPRKNNLFRRGGATIYKKGRAVLSPLGLIIIILCLQANFRLTARIPRRRAPDGIRVPLPL